MCVCVCLYGCICVGCQENEAPKASFLRVCVHSSYKRVCVCVCVYVSEHVKAYFINVLAKRKGLGHNDALVDVFLSFPPQLVQGPAALLSQPVGPHGHHYCFSRSAPR